MKVFKAGLYESVMFEFLGGGEEPHDFLGNVIVREGEMALEIPGGDGPYLIVGQAKEHWFEGINSDLKGWKEVAAKWTWLDGSFVGTWSEDNCQFLFSFKLGTASKK